MSLVEGIKINKKLHRQNKREKKKFIVTKNNLQE